MAHTETGAAARARMNTRELRLALLGFSDYAEYVASDHWRGVRAEYRRSGRPQRCVLCDGERVQLHHRTYERLGCESLDDLVPLCPTCHADVHVWEREGVLTVGSDPAGMVSRERAATYHAEQGPRAERAAAEVAPDNSAWATTVHNLRAGVVRWALAICAAHEHEPQDIAHLVRGIMRQVDKIDAQVRANVQRRGTTSV